ncbi:uncharacterized protein LOC131553509 [Onychostoma macrolepis]|uniref:uncharacterized protein LOC131553509 n=1 Tax=Onychostoma macrolepis TaxID=369639 RepID=UPI00272D30C0|nr:uncharacterized protein LOC131553509 [Onychostoma macrolepis]
MVRRLCHTEEERVLIPELSPVRAPVPELSQRRLPCLSSGLKARRLTNACPPTCSRLLLRCRLAAPLLAFSPPSMRCELRGTAILHVAVAGVSLDSTSSLYQAPSVNWLRRAPSSLRLHLGLSSTILRIGTPLLRLRLVPPAPSGSPSLWLLLSPLSLRLHRGHLDPHLRLSHRRHLLRLGPPDPPWLIGSPSPQDTYIHTGASQ